MGRHSAPDDAPDDEVASVATETVVDVVARRGRHAVPDEEPEPGGSAAQPAPAADTGQPDAPAAVAKGNQSTAADLALLRAHSDVRARVIAAIVAPFALYTVTLYLAGGMGVYFLWIWIPLVTAGVLAGSILDAAHRKRGSG